MYTKTGSSGAERVTSKLVTFANAVLTVSCFFAYRWMIAIANYAFLSAFLLFRATNPPFGSIRNKKNL